MVKHAKSRELIPHNGAGAVALPDALIDQARDLAEHSLSKRTREEYARCWAKFKAWCNTNGQQALPCELGALAGYITWLTKGQGIGRPLAISSINQAISAIKMAHRDHGMPLDTDHPILQKVWTGARREIAAKRTIRRVSPILSADLREILEMLRKDNLREARDAAILAVGWGAARRRSELVGLDWQEPGDGTGFMRADGDGITLVLLTGKTHQDHATEYYITREAAPFLCSVIEHWVAFARIERGSPVFRPIVKGKGGADVVGATRLDVRSVSRIVKRRLYMLLKRQESEKAARRRLSARDLKAKVESFSSHSMRAGHVTDAAERGVPDHHTMRQTGHKTKAMLGVYSRVTDAKKKSSLRGAGL
jgi:integrase